MSDAKAGLSLEARLSWIRWAESVAECLGLTKTELAVRAIEALAADAGFDPPPARTLAQIPDRTYEFAATLPPTTDDDKPAPPSRPGWTNTGFRVRAEFADWLGRLADAAGRTRPDAIGEALVHWARAIGFTEAPPPRVSVPRTTRRERV